MFRTLGLGLSGFGLRVLGLMEFGVLGSSDA